MNRDEYVYLTCKTRMSQKALAAFMYAIIITKAAIKASFGVGIYEYSKEQNSRHTVDVMIHIHPSQIVRFEQESGVKLREPIKLTINKTP